MNIAMRKGLIACGIASLALASALWTGVKPCGHAKGAALSEAKFHRPTALALSANRRWLYVANSRGGTITTIDTSARKRVAETPVGKGVADVALFGGDRLLAVDETANELVELHGGGPNFQVAHRLFIRSAPVSVRVVAHRSLASVACLWSRQITLVDLSGDKPGIRTSIALPFAPRCQLIFADDTKLLVADAFGGQLAVIDLARAHVESVRNLPAHNIRGLTLSADGKHVLITHQTLSALATTSQDDIHWGNLLANNLRSLALATVLDPTSDLLKGSQAEELGEIGSGAGDPGAITMTATGTTAVVLSGVGEIAVRANDKAIWKRHAIGTRPSALAIDEEQRRLYIANTLDDAIAVFDLDAGKRLDAVALGTMPDFTPADRGEILFYNARLSHEHWLSCHSCHTDGHSNGGLNDNLSDGSYGTPKRVLSLRGARDTAPYAWNGKMPDLETQIRTSIHTTMRGKPLSTEQVRDLAAFLRTLPPPPGLDAARLAIDQTAVTRGQQVFTNRGCDRCHVPPLYTSNRTFQVGTGMPGDVQAFNPPSLRGVSQGQHFFHDNRAAALEEVFTRLHHQIPEPLPKKDLADLLAFLRSI